MQPSVFVSQHPTITIGLAIGLLYLNRVVYALRGGVAWLFQTFFATVIAAVIAMSFAASKGVMGPSAELVGIFFGGIAFCLFPKRSPYIPPEAKKPAVAGSWRKYGSKNHHPNHLNHIVPFSKGESHTPDNLRVLPQKNSAFGKVADSA